MNFDLLDEKMRAFETARDECAPSGVYMVARIDGRSFTRLTKELHKFDAPFDARFRDYMIETVKHLMSGGFNIVYGYTQSDEISLLFHRDDGAFQRKLRKLHSVLAGETSAKFSLCLGSVAAFDCRISELPTTALVIDYFRWRSEDARRNCLNAHCYWTLRKEGASGTAADAQISGLSIDEKISLLSSRGIVFEDIPAWQKHGIGVFWEEYEKDGYDPVAKMSVKARRKRLTVNPDLPHGDAYSLFLAGLLEEESTQPV